MKKSVILPLGVVVAYFTAILTFALLMSSCGTGHVMCDAYGDSGIHITEDVPGT
tara:strand:+ start:704 stop:865 length:162 start_codon:yes stop_codon:yes gene_type:complete